MVNIPAFPSKGGMVFYVPSDLTEQAKTEVEKLKLNTDGMKLRDYFAAKVLPVVMPDNRGYPMDAAKVAYAFADAMMKAREHE